MAPLTGSRYCWAHDPARARDRAASRKKGGQNRRRPKVATADVGAVRLRSVSEIQRLLEAVAMDTLALENSVQRTRALAAILGQALKALEVGELEERMAAIEAQLAGAGDTRNGERTDA